MRYLFFLLIFTVFFQSLFSQNTFNSFFEAYIKDGKVDYESILKNTKTLDELTAQIEAAPASLMTDLESDSIPQESIAYLINSYNLLVIKNIINEWPVESVRDIPGFFDRRKNVVAGTAMTLNALEKKLIPTVEGGIIHLALICGAKGCPPIPNSAFSGKALKKSLDEQARLALNNPDFIRVSEDGKNVEFSEIFKWYRSDFEANDQSVIQFVNRYREKSIDTDNGTGKGYTYYTYDWGLNGLEPAPLPTKSKEDPDNFNIQTYTPSILLKKRQIEIKSFHNLYTQTQFFDNSGKRIEMDGRINFYTSINQVLYGISRFINVGFDVWAKSTLVNGKNQSALNTLRFEDSPDSRTELIYAGPKFKVAPFKKIPRLSFQSTFLFPLTDSLEGTSDKRAFLETDRHLWINQFFYDQPVGDKFQLFFQLAPWVSFPRNSFAESTFIETPLSAFVSYFPTDRITLYWQGEYWSTHRDEAFSSYFIQTGLGSKYQILPGRLEAEVLYTNFVNGSLNQGAGNTYNFGLRYIR